MRTQSTLTRSVFRALSRDRPFAFADCHRREGKPLICRSRLQLPRHSQQRPIFGLSFNAIPRGLAAAKNTPGNLEIALGRLVDLVRGRRTESRIPSPEEISEALRFLFRSHIEKPRRFSRNEIFLATEGVKHLYALPQGDGIVSSAFAKDDVNTALRSLALARGEENYRSDTSALAYLLFQRLQADKDLKSASDLPSGDHSGEDTLRTYVDILSSTGSAREALKLLQNSPEAQQNQSMAMWVTVVEGLFSEGLEKDAWQTLDGIQASLGELDPFHHEHLTIFLARRDNIHASKKAYAMKMSSGGSTTLSCRLAIVNLCVRHKQYDWSKPVLTSLLPLKDDPKVVNTVLVWHAAQGAARVHPELALRNALDSMDMDDGALTITNFNHLIDFAYSVNDPGTGASYLEMAKKLGLRPDAQTYLLQLAYQLKTGDMMQAKSTYQALSSVDVPTDGSDVPVLNRFLAAICFLPEAEMGLITQVVDLLLDRNADLDAETVAGLCHVFLRQDDLQEATGLLRHRADGYPATDRARISAIFQSFILDPQVPDHRAFNAYTLFRVVFAETSVERRLILMKSFFDRKRSDLACLVFGHMRQREDPEARPTSEAYAQCFEGIAKCRDVDGLQMVYNMLKLDLEVEQTTKVHNACMAAYTACQMPFTAIIDHFWKIMDSREGPTLSSFALALRACETWVPQGSQEARRIIALMQSWGFDITKEIYHCYIGALAGQSEFENTVELIEEMQHDIGERPDAVTIGTFYNAIPWQFRKDEVEIWAKQAYPDLWEDLLSYGDEIDEEFEVRYFKVDRSIDINDEPLFAQGEYDPQIAHDSQAMLESPIR